MSGDDGQVRVAIPGYEQFELLGAGGFSRVWKAFQPRFRRWVAIKILIVDIVDEAAIKAFERECFAMGQVSSHPNIVTVLDSGLISDDRPFIVMEYFAGGTYSDMLETGPLSIEELLRVGVKISGALQTAHDAGILHRDIKPHNIFVSRFNEPALGDFGISKIDQEKTSTGFAGYTVHYAPPEVLDGRQATRQSDLYSLGATLFRMIEGVRPFDGPDQSIVATAVRVVTEPPPRITRADCPPALKSLVERLMSKEVADRPDSAAEVAVALQRIQAEEGFRATDIVLAGRGAASGDSDGVDDGVVQTQELAAPPGASGDVEQSVVHAAPWASTTVDAPATDATGTEEFGVVGPGVDPDLTIARDPMERDVSTKPPLATDHSSVPTPESKDKGDNRTTLIQSQVADGAFDGDADPTEASADLEVDPDLTIVRGGFVSTEDEDRAAASTDAVATGSPVGEDSDARDRRSSSMNGDGSVPQPPQSPIGSGLELPNNGRQEELVDPSRSVPASEGGPGGPDRPRAEKLGWYILAALVATALLVGALAISRDAGTDTNGSRLESAASETTIAVQSTDAPVTTTTEPPTTEPPTTEPPTTTVVTAPPTPPIRVEAFFLDESTVRVIWEGAEPGQTGVYRVELNGTGLRRSVSAGDSPVVFDDVGPGHVCATVIYVREGQKSPHRVICTDRPVDQQPVEKEFIDLSTGDCLTYENSESKWSDIVEVVDCSHPHTLEVFAAAELPGATDSFPGDEEVETQSGDLCQEEFYRYVGVEYSDSIYYQTYWFPTEASWAASEYRWVVCALYQRPEDESEPDTEITGSARGSRS